MATRYFTPKLFAFLRDLAANNDRDWFMAHHDDYERHVRQPALRFIADMAAPLETISPHFTADARKVGGSLFRIQRDLRFSPNGNPYKTYTGIHFRHSRAGTVATPGFYLNLEPGRCYLGVGLMHPETRVAYAIRGAIDAEPRRWTEATRDDSFVDSFTLIGDSLVRTPRGFDEDHPLIADLKRKDFVGYRPLTHKEVSSADLMEHFVDNCRRGAPLVEFLCGAVGVPF